MKLGEVSIGGQSYRLEIRHIKAIEHDVLGRSLLDWYGSILVPSTDHQGKPARDAKGDPAYELDQSKLNVSDTLGMIEVILGEDAEEVLGREGLLKVVTEVVGTLTRAISPAPEHQPKGDGGPKKKSRK